ncbi:MAG: hypothetical protein ACKVGW_21385 [Verrucomicrobiia bacterium]
MTFQPRKPTTHAQNREVWRSRLDKHPGPGMLLTLIPTLLMCTFLVLAAPYLKPIVMRVLNVEKDYLILNVDLAEDTEPVAPVVPPPNPDLANAEFYQKLYDEQGFDWKNPPKLEIPEIEYVEIQKEIKPVEVELPLMMNVPLIISEELSKD